MQSKKKSNAKYIWAFVILLVAGLAIMFVCLGLMMTTRIGSAPAPYPTSGAVGTPAPLDPLSGVDDALNKSLKASIAYNAPDTMKRDETVTIQLLLNPSVTEAELQQQVEASGAVTTGTIQVTPLMKAELFAQNDAFEIAPLHDSAEQPISATETTRWQWDVTAKKEGTQRLTLVIYMLVKYNKQDYWREVETYRNDIAVNVTFLQRLQAFNWEWLVGILFTSGIVPFLWRWYDKRRQSRKQTKNSK